MDLAQGLSLVGLAGRGFDPRWEYQCFVSFFFPYRCRQLCDHLPSWLLTVPCKKTRFFGHSLCKWGHFERVKTTLKMLLASWFLVCFFKKFRCFNAENLGSVGQWAAKLPAIKLSEWLDRDRESNPSRLADWGRGRLADFFLRPPTLTASNFAALWPTDPKFSAFKHLNLFKSTPKIKSLAAF